MNAERRYCGVELRAEGRQLIGPAIRYGDTSPTHREQFAPGAFNLDNRTRWLDVRHDTSRVIAWTGGGGLTLSDTRDALMVRAELPQIPAADKALADIAAGRLTGLSIEFKATAEHRENGIRVVTAADLNGIGVVSAPSYQQSTVEIRARSGRTMRATIPSNKAVACRCSGGNCSHAQILDEALEEMIREVFEETTRDVIAGFGSYDMPLASIASGTLRGRMVGKDAQIDIDIPEGAAGLATIAAHDAAGTIVRPVIDADRRRECHRGHHAHLFKSPRSRLHRFEYRRPRWLAGTATDSHARRTGGSQRAAHTASQQPAAPRMAITITAQELADETAATVARATRVLPVATEAVTRLRTRLAPDAIQNEAGDPLRRLPARK